MPEIEEKPEVIEVEESEIEKMEEPLVGLEPGLYYEILIKFLFLKILKKEGFDVESHNKLRETLPFIKYEPIFYKFSINPLKISSEEVCEFF